MPGPRSGRRTHKSQQLLDRAIGHHQAGQLSEAERLYADILSTDPGDFDARHLLGVVRYQQGRSAEAVDLIAAALEIYPDSGRALSNYGLVLSELGRLDEAVAALDQAVAADPDLADAHNSRGHALQRLGRNEDALTSFERALALQPNYVEAHNNRGNALQGVRRYAEALASYDRALALRPDYPQAHYNRGSALKQLKRNEEALAAFDTALTLRPGYAEALFSRGDVLSELKRHDEAVASYERAIAIWPDHPHALSGLADTALAICDWKRVDELSVLLASGISAGMAVVNPFTLIRLTDDPALHLICAEAFVRDRIKSARPTLRDDGRWKHDKIRVAYLSADYHSHATAYLIAELIELHDRSRFEMIGVSFGPDDGSDIRKRLSGSFDRFLDVRTKSDREIARCCAALEIDIAVDLKGYTAGCAPRDPGLSPGARSRSTISAIRAPWARSTSTTSSPTGSVVPLDQQPFYSEKIVHLPDSYQANDRKRAIVAARADAARSRAAGDGFVFCCFNNSYKISRPVFDVWMRLLRRSPAACCGCCGTMPARKRICGARPRARGVDPARLVFAAHAISQDHLARHRLADLFLDTLPYNAHTTASDALWAGLPVVTCQRQGLRRPGRREPADRGRLAGAGDARVSSDYEALALRLATNAAALKTIRDKLAQNRLTCPLFDTDRFRRHIETAYETMWDRWQRGEPPHGFSVPAKTA